jgi:hypothetical protein
MTKDEALDLALEALESCGAGHITDGGNQWHDEKLVDKAITAIKQARSAPVQEPVAWILTAELDKRETTTRAHLWFSNPQNCMWTPIYTTPPIVATPLAAQQKPWVGLTDEEIEQEFGFIDELLRDCVHRTEAKLKEKNESHRQHVTDGNPCWCAPETSYTDPETGASVIVHKEPQ